MAEFQITLDDLEKYIEDCLSNNDTNFDKKSYKLIIMSALTMDDSSNTIVQQENAESATDLWNNKIGTNSKLLWGKKYIKIKDVVLAFIRAALISGFIDGIIALCIAGPAGVTIPIAAAASNATIEVHKVIKEAYNLKNNDFCVFFQAVSHHKTHKKFTAEDLESWFPNNSKCECNITQEKWDCEFMNAGKCEYLSKNNVIDTLNSLCEKKILYKIIEGDKTYYQFAR